MTHDSVPPQLADLLARYLRGQASAHQEGLALGELPGEVVPHESASLQPVEPRLAWDEALAAARWYRPNAEASSWLAPPDWPLLVSTREPEPALAFCSGNFPQLARSLDSFLHASNPVKFSQPSSRAADVPALITWADQVARKRQYPQMLLAAGALRLARHFDHVKELLTEQKNRIPVEWRNAWANEAASLAWHSGQADDAVAQWQSQPDSVPVFFNRGMAALFLGRPSDARDSLAQAVQQLPEKDGWHHLGRLYLALAEMRG